MGNQFALVVEQKQKFWWQLNLTEDFPSEGLPNQFHS
jgi:hypothetical protein